MAFNKLKPCMSGNGNLNLTLNRDDECLPSVRYLGWCEHGIYVGLTRVLSLWRSLRYHFCLSFCLRLSYFNVRSLPHIPFFYFVLLFGSPFPWQWHMQRKQSAYGNIYKITLVWFNGLLFFGHSCCLLRLKIPVSLILFRINS